MNSVLKKEMPNLAVLSNEELKNIDVHGVYSSFFTGHFTVYYVIF